MGRVEKKREDVKKGRDNKKRSKGNHTRTLEFVQSVTAYCVKLP